MAVSKPHWGQLPERQEKTTHFKHFKMGHKHHLKVKYILQKKLL